MIDGTSRKNPRARVALALLLAGVAAPVGASSASTGSEGQPVPDNEHPEIVVIAPPLFPDVQPERDLDRDAIDSYGVSTIDELLSNLQAETGDLDGDQPLILVNGERVDDLQDIGAYPVEALRNVQVLPRGTAVRVGGKSGQRVVSLTLNRNLQIATLTAAPRYSTDGDWHAFRGEAILTHIRGATRANIALRGRTESALLESDRDIVQPSPFAPYATTGNIVGFPFTSGEIDPVLSALAGQLVTVAPIPLNGDPTLAAFAAGANDPATTDLGDFRSLRPTNANYDLNGTFNTRLAPWLTTNATVRFNRSTSESLRGLPTALFLLPASNPASPFSRDVAIAAYGPDPLHYRSLNTGGEGSVTFSAKFRRWIGYLNLRHAQSRDVSTSEREAQFGFIPLGNGIDPFTTDFSTLIPLLGDRATARTTTDLAQVSATGPALKLPAGDMVATIEGRLAWNRLSSSSTYPLIDVNGRYRRSEQSLRAAFDIPLTSSAGFGKSIGDSSINAEYSRVHFSDAGTLDHYALGVTWEPVPPLRLRASIEESEAPPTVQILANPVIITPEVRVFDPLTGQTVDVTQITGGNPDLLPEKVRIKRLTGLVRLLPRLNLQLNGEYTDTQRRNFVSSLPEASAAITLAFPDRFVRDPSGTLTSIDLRPVNFDSDHEKRFRWGVSMNARVRGGPKPALAPGSTPGQVAVATAAAARKSTYLQITANHTVVFSDRIVIRSGLDPVDLLGGGAIGIGGGRLRHQVDGTAAITNGGLGARVGLIYRGASSLDTRIGSVTDTVHFSPLTILNLRAFADIKQVIPTAKWARGLRVSVDVLNVLNDRQHVRDSFGNTPLQYQPGYRDPLGRTIEFEIRKVF